MISDTRKTPRRVRRHIQTALTGAVLGAGLIAVPAYAATYVVNTTADVVNASDGFLSLREAISDANADPGSTVEIDGTVVGVGANPVFAINSPLPALINGTTVETSNLTTLGLPSGLIANDDAYDFSDSSIKNITGDVTTNESGGVDAHNADINGNVTANDDSEINIHENSSVTGSVTANGNSEIDIDDSAVTGSVTANDNSEIYISGISTVNGNVTANGESYIDVSDSSTLTGAVTLNDGADISLSNTASVTGNVTVNNEAYLELYGASNINGDVTVNEEAEIELNNTSHIIGNVTINGDNNSQINLYNFSYIDGNLTINDKSEDTDLYNKSYITGNLTTNDNSGIEIRDNAHIDGDVTANDNSNIDLYSHAYISGLVEANDTSKIKLYNNSYIDNDAIANDSAHIRLDDNATITGDAEANDNSIIRLYGSSQIQGDTNAYDHAQIVLKNSDIWGDVTLNDDSLLRNKGFSVLNNGVGTTTFGSNATFAPNVTSAPLTVDALVLSNSKLQPWFDLDDVPLTGLPVAGAGPITVLNSISVVNSSSRYGTFDSNVVSPLDVGIDYALNPNEVRVYFNSNQVDFNRLPGSENAGSFGAYLSKYFNDSQTNPNVLDITALPDFGGGDLFGLTYVTLMSLEQTSHDGNLSILDDVILEGGLSTYSARNTQAYWNQKAFVEIIKANLNNAGNMSGSNPNTFALNQASTLNTAPVQLATLRQAMTPSLNRFNLDGNSGSSGQGVWASYNGNHQNTDGDSGIGSSDWSSSSDGFTLGYTSGGERFSWGVAAGHQKSDLSFDNLGDVGEQDGYNVGLYGTLKGKSAYLTGILGYGRYKNDTQNGIGESNFRNKATSASLEIGKHLSNKKSGGLTPYASVLYSKIKQDGAVVSSNGGGGIGDLVLQGNSNSVFTTELGLRYNHRMFDKSDILKGGWQAGLAWLHQGGDTGFSSTFGVTGVPGSFGIKNTPLDGNALVVRLGAYGRIHNNLIGFAGYQGTFGSNQKINAVNAGVGYQF